MESNTLDRIGLFYEVPFQVHDLNQTIDFRKLKKTRLAMNAPLVFLVILLFYRY